MLGAIFFLFSKAAKKTKKPSQELEVEGTWRGQDLPWGRISSNPLQRGISVTFAQRPPVMEIPQASQAICDNTPCPHYNEAFPNG